MNKLKIKNWKLKIFLVILLSLIFNLKSVSSAHAQSVDLGIYPPIIQIQATAPTNTTTPFFIQNFSDSTVDLNISVKPFTASPAEDGTVSFLDNLNSFPDPSLLQKVRVEDGEDNPIQTITLSPKQKRNLNLKIEIPQNQDKGDYYMSLIFTSKSEDSTQANSSQASAAITSNILLSVGPVGETRGYVEDFSTSPLVTKGPLAFTIKVKNTSDHYITPKGDIVITNMFGQRVGKVNLLPVNILSNTVRRIPDSIQADANSKQYASIQAIIEKNQFPVAVWPEKFLLGPYTASLTIALSDTGPLFKRSIVFFAFPTEYLLGIILIIIVIIFIIIRVKQKIV